MGEQMSLSILFKKVVLAAGLGLLVAMVIMDMTISPAEAAGGCSRPETIVAAKANFTYAKGVANCDYVHSLSRTCICQFATQGDPGLQVTVRDFVLFSTLCKVFPLTLNCHTY
ncbi:hypothetical protein O6H91_02G070600 [Diphasiastrum complanatum]|uniref:Uncharacterized protein n=1 Tax=Diphasiastrum complanatum TaxID=34168 RepID=A0ACC2EGR9_DIPCM|nr:hypothetical protein O6H91_02G070600 [Diphasiastrum complanatum]